MKAAEDGELKEVEKGSEMDNGELNNHIKSEPMES